MGIRNETMAKAWRQAAEELVEQAHCLHETAAELEARAGFFVRLAETLERPELYAVGKDAE